MDKPPYQMLTIREMFSADVVTQANEAMRSFNESFTTGVQRAAYAVAAREEQRIMANEQELLNVIAAAQRQLDSLARIPREEPVNEEHALFFAVVTKPVNTAYTYAVVRIAAAADTYCWYVTGQNAPGKVKHWEAVREFFAGRGIQSWEQLYTRNETIELVSQWTEEVNADEEDDRPKPMVEYNAA